jgi:hypothetical protein
MVASPMLEMGVRRPTTSHEDASHFTPAGFRHHTPWRCAAITRRRRWHRPTSSTTTLAISSRCANPRPWSPGSRGCASPRCSSPASRRHLRAQPRSSSTATASAGSASSPPVTGSTSTSPTASRPRSPAFSPRCDAGAGRDDRAARQDTGSWWRRFVAGLDFCAQQPEIT